MQITCICGLPKLSSLYPDKLMDIERLHCTQDPIKLNSDDSELSGISADKESADKEN